MRVAEETCVGSAGAPPAASGAPPDAPGVGLRSFAGPVCEGDAFSECGVPGEAPGTAGGAPALPPAHLLSSFQILSWVGPQFNHAR